MGSLPVRYPELGARFSCLMDEKGWTITQLAGVVPVTFATIARLRKGQTRPRPTLLKRLAEILDVSESEIIGDDGPKSRKMVQGGKLSAATKAPTDALPRGNTIEGKMARIQTIRKLIAEADNLKPELQRLCDELQAEIQRVKEQAMQSP